MVMMDQPIKKAMNKLEAVGRLVQWAIKLSQFSVEYRPRTTIKARALAGFIAKFTLPDDKKAQDESKWWTILTDRSSVQKKEGVGVIINTPEGETLKYGVRLQFPATNNEAEYEAILIGLKIGRALRAKNLFLKSDSKLVIGQKKRRIRSKKRRRMQK